MKTKEGLKLRTLGREFVLTAEGSAKTDFSKVVSMNSSAAFVWNSVQGKEFDAAEVTRLLLSEYEIDEESARKDAEALVAKWQKIGIVTE